jgi:hypothetical protein
LEAVTSIPDASRVRADDAAASGRSSAGRVDARGFWLLWAGWLLLPASAVVPAAVLVVVGAGWLLLAHKRVCLHRQWPVAWTAGLAVVLVGLFTQMLLPVSVGVTPAGRLSDGVLDVAAVALMAGVVLAVGWWGGRIAPTSGGDVGVAFDRWREVWQKTATVAPAAAIAVVVATVDVGLRSSWAVLPLGLVALSCGLVMFVWWVRVLGTLVGEATGGAFSADRGVKVAVWVIGIVLHVVVGMGSSWVLPTRQELRLETVGLVEVPQIDCTVVHDPVIGGRHEVPLTVSAPGTADLLGRTPSGLVTRRSGPFVVGVQLEPVADIAADGTGGQRWALRMGAAGGNGSVSSFRGGGGPAPFEAVEESFMSGTSITVTCSG